MKKRKTDTEKQRNRETEKPTRNKWSSGKEAYGSRMELGQG